MKIIKADPSPYLTFGDLRPGEVFQLNSNTAQDVWMKVSAVDGRNAADIVRGVVHRWINDADVKRFPNATLYLEGKDD